MKKSTTTTTTGSNPSYFLFLFFLYMEPAGASLQASPGPILRGSQERTPAYGGGKPKARSRKRPSAYQLTAGSDSYGRRNPHCRSPCMARGHCSGLKPLGAGIRFADLLPALCNLSPSYLTGNSLPPDSVLPQCLPVRTLPTIANQSKQLMYFTEEWKLGD